jgi:selenocysteine lyase/cysteine desulfurase
MYSLSEKSEEAYHHSKELVGELLNCKGSEIIYSYNSTYAINLIAQSLVVSDVLKS